MGNRAVLAFDTYTDESIGMYLHWNGGRDSVEGFLEAARRLAGMKRGDKGDRYTNRAKLVEVIGVFFGGSSHHLDKCKRLDCDNWDNGVYVIDTERLRVCGRFHFDGKTEQHVYGMNEFADEIMDMMDAVDEAREAQS